MQISDHLDIIALFKAEFAHIADRFEVYYHSIKETRTADLPHIWKPGCYIYYSPTDNTVIKVGRSFSNSRKRSLEHIRDNTGGTMAALEDHPDILIILINVKELQDIHWVAALEVFLELKLSPSIKSARLG